MLYVRHEGCNGLEILIPIRDDNVYIRCETCGELKPVEDPLEYIADLGNVDASFQRSFNECDECADKRYELEEEYCKRMREMK